MWMRETDKLTTIKAYYTTYMHPENHTFLKPLARAWKRWTFVYMDKVTHAGLTLVLAVYCPLVSSFWMIMPNTENTGSCSNAKWARMTESDWLCSTIEYQLYPIWAMYVDHSSLSGFQLFHGARLLSEKLSTAASRHVSPTITTDCWLSQVRGVALQNFGCQTKCSDSHNNDMTQCADGCRDRRRRGAEGM